MTRDRDNGWLKWALVGLIAVAATMCLVSVVFYAAHENAGDLRREQLVELYGLAYAAAGIGVPEHPPKVYRVSRATLSEIVCHRDCNVRAANFADAVFLTEDIDPADRFDLSIVVHEFAHYVQWVFRGNAVGCEEKRRREVEAFQIQARVLDQWGLTFPVPELPLCQEPAS